MASDDKFFDRFELKAMHPDELEVGKVYPLHGMITNILEEVGETIVVEINFQHKITHIIPSPEKRELLKGRSFEPAIFISTITKKLPSHFEAQCQTVVFGKRQAGLA